MNRVLFGLILLAPIFGFSQADSPLLLKLLKENTEELGPAGSDLKGYETQIIYTQIDRDENNTPRFTAHHFNVDEYRYFYPASTVKMPTAVVALENSMNWGLLD